MSEPQQSIDSRVVVVGGTPAGVATAVRTARDGLDTMLVTYNENVSGMMASGLSYSDTITMKQRATILEEFFEGVRTHYRETYGADSEQYDHCENGYVFEPHVAQAVFDDLVADEPNLEIIRRYHPMSVERDGDELVAVTVASFDDDETVEISGETFVDATYEGDLAADAGVPCRVGREGREEYDEQFAGKLFVSLMSFTDSPIHANKTDIKLDALDGHEMTKPRGVFDIPKELRTDGLDLYPGARAGAAGIFDGSTGEGDGKVQAYNYRFCLDSDPDNRRMPEKPDTYDREDYVDLATAGSRVLYDDLDELGLRAIVRAQNLPNGKIDMNTADLPGENWDYPEADWERREEIAKRHRNYALGLLYFLQNDDAVPEKMQSEAREWGLAKDEFVDNDNIPWQLYVREARRIRGRYTFTENDARLSREHSRAPVKRDSIAIAEFPLDAHASTTEYQPGSQRDGEHYLTRITKPSQVPYRILLPEDLENLLVPCALSATHIGFGTLRLEPTWMHIGESVGIAAGIAADRGVRPGELDPDGLQQTLVERGIMVSFFNEFDMGSDDDWVSAIQFLGAKGLFSAYDARPDDPLDAAIAPIWADAFAALLDDDLDPDTIAGRIDDANRESEGIQAGDFIDLLATEAREVGLDTFDTRDALTVTGVNRSHELTRGDACKLFYTALEETAVIDSTAPQAVADD